MIEADKRRTLFLLHQEGMSSREISRRLGVSRNTVKAIIEQKGVMPNLVRRGQGPRIDPDLLGRLYAECEGVVQRVHEKLVEEEGIEVTYPTLTRMIREMGLRRAKSNTRQSAAATQEWLNEIINGARSFKILQTELHDSNHLATLLHHAKNGRIRERKKATVILARKRGISNTTIAKILHSSKTTTRQYFKVYHEDGPSGLFGLKTRLPRTRNGDTEKTRRILELLHHKPNSFGVNRTSWTQQTIIQVYTRQYTETISKRTVARLIKNAGYGQ
jgi:transposase